MDESTAIGFWRWAASDGDRVAVIEPDARSVTYARAARGSQPRGPRTPESRLAGGRHDRLPPRQPDRGVHARHGRVPDRALLHAGQPPSRRRRGRVHPRRLRCRRLRRRRTVRRRRRARPPTRPASSPTAASRSATVPGFRPFDELTVGQPDTLPDERTAGNPMVYTSGTTGPSERRRAEPHRCVTRGGRGAAMRSSPHRSTSRSATACTSCKGRSTTRRHSVSPPPRSTSATRSC